MSVERPRKAAPPKKRPSCRRVRRPEVRGVWAVAGAVGFAGVREDMVGAWARAIDLCGLRVRGCANAEWWLLRGVAEGEGRRTRLWPWKLDFACKRTLLQRLLGRVRSG